MAQRKKADAIEFARRQRLLGNEYARKVWYFLRNRQRFGFKFRREHPLGIYTADFYCPQARLVVEIDGKHHFTKAGQEHDALRDQWMKQQGLRVLRFTGKQVDLHMTEVLSEIDRVLQESATSPPDPLSASRPRCTTQVSLLKFFLRLAQKDSMHWTGHNIAEAQSREFVYLVRFLAYR